MGSKPTARGRRLAIQSRYLSVNEIVCYCTAISGWCCFCGSLCELKEGIMHVVEVKHGPPGATCGCSELSFCSHRAPYRLHDCSECRNEPARCSFCDLGYINHSFLRLNMHLASIARSSSFEMPAGLVPRASAQSSPGRLSSFGFSGTIAHGAFLRSVSSQCHLLDAKAVSCYRRRKMQGLSNSLSETVLLVQEGKTT